jgi:hypothetical protein
LLCAADQVAGFVVAPEVGRVVGCGGHQ